MIRAAVLTCVAALGVFAVVQDRLTARGVAEYVTLQKEALAGKRPLVTVDEVMQPAVTRAVRQGALWGGVVLVAGFGVTLARRSRRRE